MHSFLRLSFPAQEFLVLVLILIPLLGIAGYIRIRRGKPLRPKRLRYRVMILIQIVILLITLSAAREQGIQLLGRHWGHPLIWIFAAVYIAYIGLRLRRAWSKLPPERLEKACLLLPDDPSLMRLWVAVAAMAGISEECAYRGLAYQLLTNMGVTTSLAVAVCVLTFAIGHMTQGWRGVLGTSVLALLFHALVFLTHSLYLAIGFHAVYNLMVGIIAVPILSEFAKSRAQSQFAKA